MFKPDNFKNKYVVFAIGTWLSSHFEYLFFVVTLKNAAMVLEFAAMYNAEQLKLSCLQFIGLNMAALLEAR